MSIFQFMSDDHKVCDEGYASVENLVAKGDWNAVDQQWLAFWEHTLRHFEMEEKVLFLEFENATGMQGGPTEVMRMEHEQIRGVGQRLAEAVRNRDKGSFLGLGESLMVLLQQHNMKEEQILYPMTDRALPDGAAVLERMKNV